MSKGFIKLNRSQEAVNLFKKPMESHLLFVIAMRVSRQDNPVEGIKKGEARIGDFKNYGMTEQNYRTAKKNLCKWGYITCKGTRKGTIAKLCNSDTYDLNIDTPNGQPNGQSNGQPNGQVTTNKNERIKNTTKQKEEPTESMPLGITEARQVIEETFGKGSKQIKALIERHKQNTGHSITETQALVGVSSFLQKGMVENYKGKIKRPDQVVPKLMAWLGNQMTFDYARKTAKADAKTDKTLNEYLKENYREKEYKRLNLENLNELYKKHEFFFKNITKGYENPTITPYLLLELCCMPFGNKIGGNTPERKINAFKRFYKSLSSYNQNKGDIRKLLTEWKSKGQN